VVHTGICHGDRLGVDVTEGAADWGESDQRDGGRETDDQGAENGRLFMSGPANVAEGG
jgi:hypothetical protein